MSLSFFGFGVEILFPFKFSPPPPLLLFILHSFTSLSTINAQVLLRFAGKVCTTEYDQHHNELVMQRYHKR